MFRKHKSLLLVLSILLVLSFVFAACAPAAEEAAAEEPAAAEEAEEAPADKEVVKVAFIGPLTGTKCSNGTGWFEFLHYLRLTRLTKIQI